MKDDRWTRQGIEEIFEDRYGELQGYFLKAGSRVENVDDLVSETFSKTLAALQSHPTRVSSLTHYVFRTARLVLAVHIRRTKRHDVWFVTGEDAQIAADSVADATTDREEAAARLDIDKVVRRVIDELPFERDRDILNRFYLKEERKQDIREELNVSPEQFDRLIFRARQRMRTALRLYRYRSPDFDDLPTHRADTDDARVQVLQVARQIVIESGNREAPGVGAWLDQWLHEPVCGEFGFRRRSAADTTRGSEVATDSG